MKTQTWILLIAGAALVYQLGKQKQAAQLVGQPNRTSEPADWWSYAGNWA